MPKLHSCQVCQKLFLLKKICPACRPRDIHHGKKVPAGTCQQCLEKGLKLTKAWNGKDYCSDCLKWNEEAGKQGIGTYCQHFLNTDCLNCGQCSSCLNRKSLTNHSTRDLMIEVHHRPDFEALLSWEDDSFKQRYGEIMWELQAVQGLSPPKIAELVAKDIFQKKLSKRKFSRGT